MSHGPLHNTYVSVKFKLQHPPSGQPPENYEFLGYWVYKYFPPWAK